MNNKEKYNKIVMDKLTEKMQRELGADNFESPTGKLVKSIAEIIIDILDKEGVFTEIFQGIQNNRAWIYCRVPSNDNSELSNQFNYLKDYAEKQGLEVSGTTYEVGSGLEFSREELKYMLNLAKKSMIDVILVKDISCIGVDVAKTLEYINEVKTYGVEVYGVKIMKMIQSSET